MLQQLQLRKNKVSVHLLKRHKNRFGVWMKLNRNTQAAKLIDGYIRSDINQPLVSCPAPCPGSWGLLAYPQCLGVRLDAGTAAGCLPCLTFLSELQRRGFFKTALSGCSLTQCVRYAAWKLWRLPLCGCLKSADQKNVNAPLLPA